MATKPLIVIVGPTASGKTALAIELAKKYDGEIICADSRTVYKDMDIGTAKPTREERGEVAHWGLDLIEPGQRFTAADFKDYAVKKIADIRSRGKTPFLVGGTGLYIDAVVFDYHFGNDFNPAARKGFELMTLEQLHDYCINNNIELPENDKNKRYVIRAIEQGGLNSKRKSEPIHSCYIVGITTDRELLRTRILNRAEQIFQNGVVDEAIKLSKKYGWDNEAMTGNIYPLVRLYLEEKKSLAEIKEKFTTLDRRLAKRQLTWFKRNKHIKWVSLDEARLHIQSLLANE